MSETEELIRLRARVAYAETQLEHSEKRRAQFAEQVRVQAQSIAAKCGAGFPTRAAMSALELCQRAADEKHGLQMQQEQTNPDRYDLAALRVDPETASSSETIWENED